MPKQIGFLGGLAKSPFRAALTLGLLYSLFTRLWFCLESRHDLYLPTLGKAFGLGLVFDAIVLSVLCSVSLGIYLIAPRRLKLLGLRYSHVFIGLFATAFLFFLVVEAVFWNEFHTRLNFIAVDYLLYTHEVIGNIRQSYPLNWIFEGVVGAGVLIGFLYKQANSRKEFKLRNQIQVKRWVITSLIAFIGVGFGRTEWMDISPNPLVNEISGNGLFTFFAALRRNELDYDFFYKTIPQKLADQVLREIGVEREGLEELDRGTMHRRTEVLDIIPFKRRPKNIVLISVESLSSSFIGALHNGTSITPFLDSLAKHSVQFNHFFATGTRTVRGLEALSVGIPPIPGQSIVRRPSSLGLGTIGQVLVDSGYQSFFIYGGYGYFDNMSEYFSANGYQVFDRRDFPAETIPAENIWGVADEALLLNSVRILDEHSGKKNFFAHIMTTSNHRPYTYPDGRIDIPSPGGRDGAVKYTDYALGEFFKSVRTKSWFDETLFVITADHCASVAGHTKLPLKDYKIPLWFYAPKLLAPGQVNTLASQIDLPPTFIEILGLPGDDEFLGASFYDYSPTQKRAFVSNYQELGYYKSDTLVVLSPQKKVSTYHVDPISLEATPTASLPRLELEAISYYQTAFRSYKKGYLKDRPNYRSTLLNPAVREHVKEI